MRLMKRIIGLLTLSCQGAAPLVSDSLDCRPASSERVALRLHVLCCPGCRRFDRQMRFLRLVMTRFKARTSGPAGTPGVMLPPDVRERISAALEEALNAASPVLPGALSDRRGASD